MARRGSCRVSEDTRVRFVELRIDRRGCTWSCARRARASVKARAHTRARAHAPFAETVAEKNVVVVRRRRVATARAEDFLRVVLSVDVLNLTQRTLAGGQLQRLKKLADLELGSEYLDVRLVDLLVRPQLLAAVSPSRIDVKGWGGTDWLKRTRNKTPKKKEVQETKATSSRWMAASARRVESSPGALPAVLLVCIDECLTLMDYTHLRSDPIPDLYALQ